MGLFSRGPGKRDSSGVEKAAMALAAAGGVAHGVFFALFALKIIGRDFGFGTVGYIILAFFALLGLGLNFVGYWLIKSGGRWAARKWGYLAVATSTTIASVLLAIASWTAE